MSIPSFTHRTPTEIVTETNLFESSGRAYKALSWLDFAKSNRNISALEYAALETRLAIEQLFFEQLVVGVGTRLEAREYKKCSGNANKLNEIIVRLIPRYERLVAFTKAMAPAGVPITEWDNRALIQQSGKVSAYLHWSGGLDVTIQSEKWYEKGIATVEAAANYIWAGLTTGNTGVLAIEKLEPEMRELWELYANNEITIESAVERAETLEPVLKARLTHSTGPAHEAAQAG
ncbi:hypothetical protein SBP18_02265 [Rhodoferax ferrireducens]|uniref:hypothetical protein n=1 Tax=Rhodoferax ferrireducens TaxID=192843 RepID=UPI00298E7A55|nr:hypothetical protein [Rhodoferax ferrireducens]WPC67346.1 hypothetical protein SBP18_02265 [Rhodoferax ferrireducens]